MSNRLPNSTQAKTVSVKVDHTRLERFDDNLENLGYDNRSEAIRDFIYSHTRSREREQHLPERDDLREKYETLLSYANEKLVVAPRICGGELAQEFGVPKNNIGSALIDLRRRGYVAVQNGAPGTSSKSVYHVKPRCADPEQWKYREDLDR